MSTENLARVIMDEGDEIARLRERLSAAQKGMDASAETMKGLARKYADATQRAEKADGFREQIAAELRLAREELTMANMSLAILRKDIQQLRADKEKAEADKKLLASELQHRCDENDKQDTACAEMRGLLKNINELHGGIIPDSYYPHILHALSSDCGKGYVSKEELRPTIELLPACAHAAEVKGAATTARLLRDEAARLQKLMEKDKPITFRGESPE